MLHSVSEYEPPVNSTQFPQKLNTWIANPFYHMILGHEAHGLTGEAVFSGTSRAEGG